MVSEGPLDELKTPEGDPVAEVFELLQALDAVVVGAGAEFVAVFVLESILLHHIEETLLEIPFRVGVVISHDPIDPHEDADPEADDR